MPWASEERVSSSITEDCADLVTGAQGLSGFFLENMGRCWARRTRSPRGDTNGATQGAPPTAGNEKTWAQEGATTVQMSTPRTATVRVSTTGSLFEVTHTLPNPAQVPLAEGGVHADCSVVFSFVERYPGAPSPAVCPGRTLCTH